MHSSWLSFNDMLSARRVSVIDETLTVAEANELAIRTLDNPDCNLSYRFELIVPKRKNCLNISVRALPANPHYLNDNEHLSGHDVGSLHVTTFEVANFKMPPFCSDLQSLYPCGAVMFSENMIDMNTYKSLIIHGMQPLMHRFRVHADFTVEEVKVYMKTTKAKSGNLLRFPEHAMTRKRSHEESTGGPSGSPGSTFSKFGANYNIFRYCPLVPVFIRAFFAIGLSTSSWKCYRTGWDSFSGFLNHIGYSVTLPATVDTLLMYINYLIYWKKVKLSTVKSYLSHIKTLHKLNRVSVSQFDDIYIHQTLQGISNWQAALNIHTFQRNVFTYEILCIWGHTLQTLEISDFDRQVVWVTSLIAFWASARLGQNIYIIIFDICLKLKFY